MIRGRVALRLPGLAVRLELGNDPPAPAAAGGDYGGLTIIHVEEDREAAEAVIDAVLRDSGTWTQ